MSANDSHMPIEVDQLVVAFGGVRAVDGVTLSVAAGETLGIVGPNGAGKSTFLSILAGANRPTGGSARVFGRDVTGLRSYEFARLGIGLAHQVPKPFRKLTVRENLDVAAQSITERQARRLAVVQALELTGLATHADRLAGTLGLLDLKRLELARALALHPRLLLLDEVAAGLNGSDLDSLIELITACREIVPTIVFVEHVQDVIHALAQRVVVLDWGKILASGTPAEIQRDERVVESYLGGGGASHVAAPALEVSAPTVLIGIGMSASYGQVQALRDVSIEGRAGEIIGVFGANGAGKTTLSKALIGSIPCQAGSIEINGTRVDGMPPHQRVAAGIALSPEGRRLFASLTVRQNLELGLVAAKDRGGLDHAMEAFPKLEQLLDRRAGGLSGGEQQMVAIGRALASQPRVLVLDEMSLGLAPVVVDRLYEAVQTIAGWGTCVVMVEQSIQRARSLAHRALLLQQGRPAFWGPAAELTDEDLHQAYLGTGGEQDGIPAVGPRQGR